MRVLGREAVIPAECLAAATALVRVSLPPVLATDPVWRGPAEERAHFDGIRDTLAEHGLWHDGALTEEFARTVTVLGRAEREFSATVETPELGYRLFVAAIGQDAALACFVPASGKVLLRPARPDALAEDLIAELPELGWGPGLGVSVPESELRAAMAGGDARPEVDRVIQLAKLPRTGGGQLTAGFRDGVHGHVTTGANPCTYYDTDQGRYLFSFTGQPGSGRYVNVAPCRPETLVSKCYGLLEDLRDPGR